MVMDLPRQVGVILVRRLENDLVIAVSRYIDLYLFRTATDLGTIREVVSSKINLAERAFADQSSQGIVSYMA